MSPETRKQGTSEDVEWGQLMSIKQAEALRDRNLQRRREQAIARPIGPLKKCPQCQKDWEPDDLVDERDHRSRMCHRCDRDYNSGKTPRCGFCGVPNKPVDELGCCDQCKKSTGSTTLQAISIEAGCLRRYADQQAKERLDLHPFWKRIRALGRKAWDQQLTDADVVDRLIDNLLAEHEAPDDNAARMKGMWELLRWMELNLEGGNRVKKSTTRKPRSRLPVEVRGKQRTPTRSNRDTKTPPKMGRPPTTLTGKTHADEDVILIEWLNRERGLSMSKFAKTKGLKTEQCRLIIRRARDRARK